MRLRALLAAERLGLTLLVGEDQLDRPLERVFTATLRDPRRYLTGGELVLSGMEWWQTPEDSDTFVAALAEAEVTALGAGTAEAGGGPVPDHVIAACRRHRLPLLEVPVTVSFATISEHTILQLAAERADGPANTGQFLDRYRRLVTAVAEGGGVDPLTAAGAAELGSDCWVLSVTGRVIAGPDAEPPDVATEFLRATTLPTVVATADGPVTLLAAAARTDHRLAGWCLAVAGDHEDWDADRRGLAGELATLVGMEHARRQEAAKITAHAAEPLLRALFAGDANPTEITARLPDAALTPAEPVCVATASLRAGPSGLAPVLLAELLAPLGERVTVAEVNGETVGLAAIAPHAESMRGAVADIKNAVRTLEAALGPARLAVGATRALDAAGLRPAVAEARQLRDLAELTPGGATVLAGGDVASHQLLLAAVPQALRRAFRAQVLGPVLDYDAEHKSDLVHTLRVFLQHSGSWTQTAAALHVHVNTLRYRVSRIAELTGRDLTLFCDRVDLYLALDP